MVATLQDLFGIDAPIVLGPFGGLSSIELTAAVSDAGGLGSYGLYGYSADRISDTIAALHSATSRPFAVNLWLPTGDEITPGEVDLGPAIEAVAPLFDELGLDHPTAPIEFLPDLDAQLTAVLDAAPAALSVVFGVPSEHLVAAAHSRGIRIIGTATTVAEAIALASAGVDAVVATGAEAGGHRVSFLRPAEQSLVGTFALVPQVVDAVDVPVIAAGGIADRRGVAAAFALGASGVQVGSAFLRTRQSAATEAHRRAIGKATDTSTVLTRALSGRLARGIPNRAMRTIETTGVIAPFPAQNWLTGQFRAEAGRRGDGDLVSLWAGQAAGLAPSDDAAEVFAELAAGLPD
jgi:nitronate monooxygenase